MKKILLSMALLGAPMSMAHADPISITTFGSTYTQNFDGLANSLSFTRTGPDAAGITLATSNGTDAATLQGFEFGESGGSSRANGSYIADDGALGTGDSINYGSSAGATDRAFGVLNTSAFANGTGANATAPGTAFGLIFRNDTGTTIDSLTISYRGEQYRYGGNASVDRIDVQIDRDGTSIIGTNFNNVNALDFSSPVRTGATGALNGNAEGNFSNINGVFAPVGGIAAGNSFVVRFSPIDQVGSDDGLAIDDFRLTANVAAVPEPSTLALFAIGMVGFGLAVRRRKAATSEERGILAFPI